MKINFKEWRNYYEDIGLSPNLYEGYLAYAEKLQNNSVPVIFEFAHLASILGRTPEYLATVVNSSENHYRKFKIKKRSGGHRIISAPYPALLECQRWINQEILSKIKTHNSAHGFSRNKSIKSNAEKHLNAKTLFKIDIEDFFPSIKINRVISIFNELGYAPNVSFYLAAICCCDAFLPQGAATSPSISNIVCRKLDNRLNKLAKKWELNYSRYADDMTFSGETINNNFVKLITSVIEDEGFSLRETKTRLIKSNKKIVTGINVSGDRLRLPKKYKRELRQIAYHIIKYGYISHASKLKIKDPYYLDKIHGKLVFWNWIEPDAQFPKKTLPKIRDVMNGFKPSSEQHTEPHS